MQRLICRDTGESYPLSEPRWRSESGGLLDIEFEAKFDRERIARRPPTMWRYREAIPIEDDANIISLDEGFTPLIPAEFFGRRVLLKAEHLFASGSYKDRGASVMISKVRELGVERVVEDSSGNAGAAIAAYCAKAGVTCDIYVPASSSAAKLVQIRLYGANLHAIPGPRAAAAAACWQAAQQHYYASHVWNPFFFHGVKTFAYELVEQLGWRTPHVLMLPLGNGTLLCGTYIGLCDLRNAGVIDSLPKLVGVQAANCAPIYEALRAGTDTIGEIDVRPTIAEGIAIAKPARAKDCLRAIRATRGEIVTVTEDEIVAALRLAARRGFYIEPTSAAQLAGLKHYEDSAETIVIPLSGHGLKASDTLARLLGEEVNR